MNQTATAAPLSPYRWVMAAMFLVGRLALGFNLFGITGGLPAARVGVEGAQLPSPVRGRGGGC